MKTEERETGGKLAPAVRAAKSAPDAKAGSRLRIVRGLLETTVLLLLGYLLTVSVGIRMVDGKYFPPDLTSAGEALPGGESENTPHKGVLWSLFRVPSYDNPDPSLHVNEYTVPFPFIILVGERDRRHGESEGWLWFGFGVWRYRTIPALIY